jgi:hypothetical protein
MHWNLREFQQRVVEATTPCGRDRNVWSSEYLRRRVKKKRGQRRKEEEKGSS